MKYFELGDFLYHWVILYHWDWIWHHITRKKSEYIRSIKGLAYKTQTLSHSYRTHGRQISKEIWNRSVQKRLCVEWDGSKKKKIVPKEDVHWTRKYVNRCKYNPPIYTTKHTSYFVSSLQIVHIHMYKNKQTCIHTQKYNQKL